jgi:hypothetical protein
VVNSTQCICMIFAPKVVKHCGLKAAQSEPQATMGCRSSAPCIVITAKSNGRWCGSQGLRLPSQSPPYLMACGIRRAA